MTNPFQVESVNQNEQPSTDWNGYISPDYSHLTERDIRSSVTERYLEPYGHSAIEDTGNASNL